MEIDALTTRIEALEAELETVEAENDRLRDRVGELETAVETLQTQTESLRTRLAELDAQPAIEVRDDSDPIGSLYIAGAPVGQAITSKPGQTEFDAELAALREDLAAFADGDTETNTPTVDAETPLEQIVAMPQEVVDAQLTANQRRARFVATDITEYASKTPAGWVLAPKDLRTVLNAAFDTSHSQTCSRVRTILADLGNEAVRIKESRGEQKLVFEAQLVGRLQELRARSHDVVSPTTADGVRQ